MKIDIVTVVYDDETYLLEWQGKSISKYFDSNYINEIIVVDNGSQKCAEKINPEWYSQNKTKLKILNHQDIPAALNQIVGLDIRGRFEFKIS